ncbi:MAG: threonylcarbamoyl-AMP synthase [Bacteroidales bacterium]|nr:threonylcarbamoyl-AMP synthase [Bacteroidales bacterium]
MNDDIKKAVDVLRQGGVILYPTDTIWGLGCDAENEDAVKKIYQIKQRSDRKSMLCLIDTPFRLEMYVEEIPEIAWDLIEHTDKPLTIIYPKAKHLAQNLIAEDGSIGIRLTNDEFCRKLIGLLQKPIVSTSANVSGDIAPTIFDEISDEIKQAVDYIVQYRQDDIEKGKASSIIKLDMGGLFKIIRE